MSQANLALRFLLEVAGIAPLAYWGYRTGSGAAARVGLAVLAPSLLGVVWALVVAPGARNPIPGPVRVLLGSVLLLVAAAALALAGQPVLAAGFAALVVVNTALSFLLPAPR